MTESTAPQGPDDPGQEPAPAKPKPHRLGRRPSGTTGVYLVLGADARDPDDELAYRPIGYYRANDDEHAKRQVVADAEAGHLPDVLEQMKAKGIYLRPIPTRSWPKDTEPTGYVRQPRLRIG